MSMFHELMMRKKEQIMYATIKGSLTENDGVFSGFSSSSYLKLQEQFKLNANTVAEFSFKINLTSFADTSGILGVPNSYGINFIVRSNTKLGLYVGNGSSWNIVDNLSGTTSLLLNTDYWLKLIFNRGNISVLLSTDGTSYTTEISTTTTISEEYTYDLAIGRARSSTQYLHGSIDLPNSYIKLGSTKYKLQAVVGYTVVGSPTITDGVVSGFQAYPNVNSGYYVKIANFTYNNTFEIKVKIRTGETIGGTILGQGNPAPRAGIPVTSLRNTNFSFNIKDQNNQDIVNLVNIGYVDARTLIVNTDYILTLKFTGTEYIYTLVDMNGTYYINRVISSSAKLRVGCLAFGINYADVAYTAWGGAIDMNETWIKTDNKLFFNGQQA